MATAVQNAEAAPTEVAQVAQVDDLSQGVKIKHDAPAVKKVEQVNQVERVGRVGRVDQVEPLNKTGAQTDGQGQQSQQGQGQGEPALKQEKSADDEVVLRWR